MKTVRNNDKNKETSFNQAPLDLTQPIGLVLTTTHPLSLPPVPITSACASHHHAMKVSLSVNPRGWCVVQCTVSEPAFCFRRPLPSAFPVSLEMKRLRLGLHWSSPDDGFSPCSARRWYDGNPSKTISTKSKTVSRLKRGLKPRAEGKET